MPASRLHQVEPGLLGGHHALQEVLLLVRRVADDARPRQIRVDPLEETSSKVNAPMCPGSSARSIGSMWAPSARSPEARNVNLGFPHSR